MGSAFGFAEALRIIEASDGRWRDPGDAATEQSFGRPALTSFAHALAFTSAVPPRWTETISTEDLAEWPHVEVRALGDRSLLVLTMPWAPGGEGPRATVRVHPLRAIRGLEIDGLRFDEAGVVVGCTVTLLFPDLGVRLGGAPDADRTALAALLPSIRSELDL